MSELSRVPLPAWASIGIAVAAGVLVGLGFAPTGAWPAAIVGVALFTWLMAGRSMRSGIALGLIFGLALNVLTIRWISVLGVPVAVGLIGFMALWGGILGVLVAVLSRIRFWWLGVPGAWVTIETLSSWIPFGGFPWNRLAFTALDQPLQGYFAFVGSTGVSFLVALVAQLLLAALLGRRRRWIPLATAAGLFIVGAALSARPVTETPHSVHVGFVQGNVNRVEKGTETYARSVTANHLSETIFLLAEQRTSGDDALDLLVWPENSTDIDPVVDQATGDTIRAAAALAQAPILVGAVMDGPEPDTRATSALWWDTSLGPQDRYDKRNLVPFGEWIPFRAFLLPRLPVLEQIGRQSVPGTGPGVVSGHLPNGTALRVGSIICFELAWDSTAYDTVLGGADVVVSQSNTNTYGATWEVPQQLAMNRVRAMELDREVLAVTLNSTSAFIDARGRVHDVTDEFSAAHRTVEMPLRGNVSTAVRLGTWPAVGLSVVTAAAFIAALVLSRRRSALDGVELADPEVNGVSA